MIKVSSVFSPLIVQLYHSVVDLISWAFVKDKRYADKYRDEGQPIHLIGVEFSKEKRSVMAFEVVTE